MKQISLLLLTAFISFCSYAQEDTATYEKRKIDVEVQVLAPKNKTRVKPQEEFRYLVTVTNHGPDDLLIGDTIVLYFGKKAKPHIATLLVDIPVGGVDTLFNEMNQLPSIGMTYSMELCMGMEADISSNVKDSNDIPVIVSWIDLNSTNNWGCINVEVLEENDPSFINDITSHTYVIYPNPSTNYLNIKTNKQIESLQLMDITGRIVNLTYDINNSGASLNVTNLSSGNYMLKIKSPGGFAHTEKIQITK